MLKKFTTDLSYDPKFKFAMVNKQLWFGNVARTCQQAIFPKVNFKILLFLFLMPCCCKV